MPRRLSAPQAHGATGRHTVIARKPRWYARNHSRASDRVAVAALSGRLVGQPVCTRRARPPAQGASKYSQERDQRRLSTVLASTAAFGTGVAPRTAAIEVPAPAGGAEEPIIFLQHSLCNGPGGCGTLAETRYC